MRTATASHPRTVRHLSILRWRRWLRRLGQDSPRDDDARFLCEAWDLADLERRLRRLEQGRTERFGPLPVLP